jgi:hypothetical protein
MMVSAMDAACTIRRLCVAVLCRNWTKDCLVLVPSNSATANSAVLASMSGKAIHCSNPVRAKWSHKRVT